MRFKVSLPITCQPFNNRVPTVWVGDEIAKLVDSDIIECYDQSRNFYSYLLKAEYETSKQISLSKVFAIDDMFYPYEPINIDDYVDRA